MDAHHHLWDLSLGRHPWITDAGAGVRALGDIGYLRRNYLPDDYLRDAAGQGIVATVHVEALWDRARDALEETLWLESLPRPEGIAARYVAHVPLDSPDAGERVAAQAAIPRVAALRETIRWHPDPAKRWTRRGLVNEAGWRRGLAALGAHGLALDLLMNPHQSEEVAALAADFPDQIFIVNHCGTPNDRDAEGIARWKRGLALMAARPNIALKLSEFAGYATDHSLPALRDTLRCCIDAFGPGRCLFASDFPVARRHMEFAPMCDAFRAILREYTPEEQRAVFHDNAARLYRYP
ncbi:amidohydrolase family protein [Roseomonas sp. OT10]|uniref:amidohydrolase family protein n=1 Tax=Roseomonas cutis TaxID=2897332 RepID=UPI002104DBE3|nr:amidohydrolase family protein [Roseomonas sp. OT10]